MKFGKQTSFTNILNSNVPSTLPSKGSAAQLPWSNELNPDKFFSAQDIDPTRWDKFYPYRLLVIDISNSNAIVGGQSLSTSLQTNTQSNDGISYVLQQASINNNWVYQFPITPSSISITDNFAINLKATATGVSEEHNGVKFKNISIQGSMGVWNQKPTIGSIPRGNGILTSLFGNTIESLNNLGNQLSSLVGSVNSDKAGPAKKPEQSDYGLESTGYFQAQLLGQFLERYAMAKKNPENANWRLVLNIPKENQSFIVTPITYSSNKDSGSTQEYRYTLQLKAWKRINLDDVQPSVSKPLNIDSPNIIDQINSTLTQTRSIIGNSMNLVRAVSSDATAPLNALRQLSLAVKDVGGLFFTMADMPDAIISSYQSSITDSLNIIKNSFSRDSVVRANGGGSSATGVTANSIKASSMTARAGNAINNIVTNNQNNEGMGNEYVANGALGSDASYSLELDGLNDVFNNPSENFELFNAIDVNTLTLTPEQQIAINNEIDQASNINQDDIRKFRNTLSNLALEISNNYGAGSALYAEIYNRPIPKERVTPMTLEENEVLLALYNAIEACDILTSTKLFDDRKIENPLQYVGGLANENGVEFKNYPSKILVPVPFGLNIEEIAVRYLKDANQWIEIVTLNNLSAPYIDEEGFVYELLSNASGRQFNVNDNEHKLYIGQKITLSSSTTPRFIRKIVNIEKISDTNYLVSVDGADDLDVLKTNENARVHGYLPATVNSQDQIYIPSDLGSEFDDRIQVPPAFQNDKLTRISKIDWLLTEEGDIAINGVGDIRLANGLNNLVQALKLKIWTERGSLIKHLNYGLGIKAGMSVADIERGELYRALELMILEDKRFSGIERMEISIEGPVVTISLSVIIANNSGVLPISFQI